MARSLAGIGARTTRPGSRVKALSAAAGAARQKLDPNDATARDALGRLIVQRDRAEDEVAQRLPPLNQEVAR